MAGGNGGAGGDVLIDFAGALTTSGTLGIGLNAVSEGGDGGSGDFRQLLGPVIPQGPFGAGGDAGAVTLINSGTIATSGISAVGARALSAGGSGDGGGTGGAVVVENTGSIVTEGTSSAGIDARSLGGQGSSAFIGGDDGTAGGGSGTITATLGGMITTSGQDADGVELLSIGGRGGDGAFDGAFIANGGDGGAGGAAGAVTVEVLGTIMTSGADATGVRAISLGGTGGAGADAEGVGANSGMGGLGGSAGGVSGTVAAGAMISTTGDGADAIELRSQGGTGGLGGDASALVGDAAGGGQGGTAAAVTFTNAGTLATAGADAHGALISSIGGAGGGGGGAGALFSFGGASGAGSAAGSVTASNTGTVTTTGTDSFGFLVQSVGGDGGDAGDSIGFIALGGSGGSAAEDLCREDPLLCNDGGAVDFTNSGSVGTSGDFAHGLLIQSVGGGGGNGGDGSGIAAVGGIGGAGGDGGTVTATNAADGMVTTLGEDAHALFAQSVGGGGGSGGDATSINPTGLQVQIAIGGQGGTGGDGGFVSVLNEGLLSAGGFDSAGIYAQSVGGGGGNGGDAFAAGTSTISLAIGGSGGDGGDGGAVSVVNDGLIAVGADRGFGIFAQSVGGGGGDGGSGFSATGAPFFAAAVAVGGSGGGGGAGAEVDVLNNGSIMAIGDDSRAIFAQSVGGGGGIGGSASSLAISASPKVSVAAAVSVGGSGGEGGDGSAVRVENTGILETFGDAGHAIQAQSVGGGGGVGGDASASAVAATFGSGTAASLSVSVGGSGGAGGDGGTAAVENTGSIVTEGQRAYGIFSQSVGGGGGEGGLGGASALQINNRAGLPLRTAIQFFDSTREFAEGRAVQIGIGVGGSGGAAGDGDAASIVNGGAVETSGYGAHALFAQSVGGGGGVGAAGTAGAQNIPLTDGAGAAVGVGGNGGASGDGGTVTVENTGALTTSGNNATALLAQSVGGGGGIADTGAGEGPGQGGTGQASSLLSFAVGGGGGASGDGGLVSVDHAGAISTLGVFSHGIHAQSIGGGGGIGGDAANSILLGAGVGGSGGAGGNGGAVSVNVDGPITTAGDGAFGILAQSIGGGGGVGGQLAPFIPGLGVSTGSFTGLIIPVAGGGGSVGDGGDVSVVGNGLITTSGAGAHGIFAQSIGGGGGISGASEINPLVSFGSSGGFGAAGAVSVDHTGGVLAQGPDSHAVFVQSLGGAQLPEDFDLSDLQDLPGFEDLPGGGILLLPDEILAEFLGQLSVGGNIDVTLSGGLYQGGSGTGAGIRLDTGLENTITIAADATVTALSGTAIQVTGTESPDLSTTIVNQGTVIGNVLMDAGFGNAFINSAGGLFEAGAVVDLNGLSAGLAGTVDSVLDNSGILSPGGAGTAIGTALTGSFIQRTEGIFALDLAPGGTSDRIDASGFASLDGLIAPAILSFDGPLSSVTIVTAAGGVSDEGVTVQDTLALDYQLSFESNAVILSVVPDFGLSGTGILNPDQESLGAHLDRVAEIDPAGLSGLLTPLANETDPDAFQAAFAPLVPEAYAAQLWASHAAALSAADKALSCESDRNVLIQTNCLWAEASGRSLSVDGSTLTERFNENSYGITLGGQFAYADNWFLGFVGGYEEIDFGQGSSVDADGERYIAGAALKYINNGFLGAVSYTATIADYETARGIAGPVPGIAVGDSSINTFGTRLRFAYAFGTEPFFVTPKVDLDYVVVDLSDIAETGAGPVGIVSSGETETVLSASPALEVGGRFAWRGADLLPKASFGVTVRSKTNFALPAVFADSPAGANPFFAAAEFDEVTYNAGVTLQAFNIGPVALRVGYEGRFGADTEQHGGFLRAAMAF